MMDDAVRLGRFADDKVHNSEFYRFKTNCIIAGKNCVKFDGEIALSSPVKLR